MYKFVSSNFWFYFVANCTSKWDGDAWEKGCGGHTVHVRWYNITSGSPGNSLRRLHNVWTIEVVVGTRSETTVDVNAVLVDVVTDGGGRNASWTAFWTATERALDSAATFTCIVPSCWLKVLFDNLLDVLVVLVAMLFTVEARRARTSRTLTSWRHTRKEERVLIDPNVLMFSCNA